MPEEKVTQQLSEEITALSTTELLQKKLKEGGIEFETIVASITDLVYENLSGYGLMTDLDSLYDITEKSVKGAIGVWAGSNLATSSEGQPVEKAESKKIKDKKSDREDIEK